MPWNALNPGAAFASPSLVSAGAEGGGGCGAAAAPLPARFSAANLAASRSLYMSFPAFLGPEDACSAGGALVGVVPGTGMGTGCDSEAGRPSNRLPAPAKAKNAGSAGAAACSSLSGAAELVGALTDAAEGM